jgi:hypothetical protein
MSHPRMGATPLAIRFGTCRGTTCDKNHRPRQQRTECGSPRNPAHVRRTTAQRLPFVKCGKTRAPRSANGTGPRESDGGYIFASARPM